MTESLHKAAQYLCCAAKSYLDPKDDDSHTNMEWSPELESLISRELGPHQEYRLALNFKSYSLEFLDVRDDVVESMYLEGASHLAIVNWIGELGMRLANGDLYSFNLHYELPYGNIDDDFAFLEPDDNEIDRLISLRNYCNSAIEHVLSTFDIEAEIRVWPHHFDSNAVVSLSSALPRSIGLGLAIADSMIDEAYFYASGWSADDSLVLDGMRDLSFGEWKHPTWNGAIHRAEEATEKEAMTFMIEAVQLIQERSSVS